MDVKNCSDIALSLLFFFFSRFYTVVAPKVLRPNSEYHVSVSTHGVERATQVWVEVGGRQDSGGRFSAGQGTTVEPRTTRIIKIEVSLSLKHTQIIFKTVESSHIFTLETIHKKKIIFSGTEKLSFQIRV